MHLLSWIGVSLDGTNSFVVRHDHVFSLSLLDSQYDVNLAFKCRFVMQTKSFGGLNHINKNLVMLLFSMGSFKNEKTNPGIRLGHQFK